MDDVISISVKQGVNYYWILTQYKRIGYEMIKHEYNPYLHEHFFLLRKV